MRSVVLIALLLGLAFAMVAVWRNALPQTLHALATGGA